MNNLTRLHYLQAMGIDVWQPRTAITEDYSVHCTDIGSPIALKNDVTAIDESSAQDTVQIDNTTNLALSASTNWPLLQAEVAACTRCELSKTRTQTVFGSGNKTADWMIIGEAPGQHEDEQGLPFVGNAGLLLTEMLWAVGVSRDDVFITNTLKCRPPSNRDPKPEETERCNMYLQQQYALIKPKIILAVGRIAAQIVLKNTAPISQLRGKVHALNNTPVVVVYHPAYLLRSPTEKRKAWVDLQLAMHTIKNLKSKDIKG